MNYDYTKLRENKGTYIFLAILFALALFLACRGRKDEFKNAELAYLNKDCKSAAKKFQELASSGDARAQNYLGKMYFNGEGVSKDRGRAVKWFTKSSQQNYPFALRNLATCYLTGRGVPKDINEALRLEVQAAANRQKTAYTQLYASLRVRTVESKSEQQVFTNSSLLRGFVYKDGKGEKRIYKDSEKSLRELAETGNVSAQTRLGMVYLSGEGVLQDFAEAARWLNKAAELGSADAQFILGNLYTIGRGVNLDYGRAAELYIMAVENKHPMAKCYLAELFSKGLGVYQNICLARILCQEGYKESGDSLCIDIWEINRLGGTGSFPVLNSSLIDYDAN